MDGETSAYARRGEQIRKRKSDGCCAAAQEFLMTAARLFLSLVLFIGAMVAPAGAQTYPKKPIRLLLPYAAGGSADVLGRLIGQKLAERLGQPMVPENRAGAAGNVAYEALSKARPDGYTIALCSGVLTTSPSLYRKLNYDPIRDFTPVSLLAQMPLVLVIRPSLPARDLRELLDYARANPGKLNYASSGIGTPPQLATELIKSLAKVNIVNVAYKGASQMMTALMGDEVDLVVLGSGAAMPGIQAGKARALAVLRNSTVRLPLLPNVPTAKEAGLENCDVASWFGMIVPAGTPREIVNRLNSEWTQIAAMPETVETMNRSGYEAASNTSEQFSEFIKTEIVRWSKVIKDANIPSID